MRHVFSVVRKIVVGVSLIGFAAATMPLARAQQNNSVRGGLGGIVTDSVGAVVPKAKVTATGSQGVVSTTSDVNGHYEITGLTPGMYSLTVAAPGFATFVSTGNEVTIDHTGTLNAKLSVGAESTTVTVEGGVTAIDTENTSVNTAITDTFYEAMPLPRNVSGAFYVAPGVVSGGGTGVSNPSIGGSSGLENLYTADGVTITDQAYGGLGVYTVSYGSLGTGINLAFVKEVDIKTAAFEPKYGQADGGIIEIVTKSGSNQYHGQIAAYVTPQFGFANRKQLYQYNYIVTTPSQTLANPAYEADAELGGYVPGFKDKLFFFGAFDPTLTRAQNLANPKTPFYALGPLNYSTTSLNWAGKLTYLPFGSTIVEASSYGDPSRRNTQPNSLSATNIKIVSSSYVYGTRNSVFRVNSSVLPWLVASGSYTYNTEHYAESPVANSYSISDRTGAAFVPYGFGTYYATHDSNWQLQGELQATSHFFGKHTTMIGYLFDHVDFNNSTLRTGNNFAVPAKNLGGVSLTGLYTNAPAGIVGASTNATFYLLPVKDPVTGIAYAAGTSGCTYCAHYKGYDVYLQQIRGTYKGSVVAALSRYKTAYGNEVWTPEKHVTINAGLRWEMQTYGGSLLTYNWRDNWSPRVGITVDPFGDRKSKIFFSYSRYQNPLPLDAAVRQLGNEQDDTNFYYAPLADASGNAVLDANGSVQPNTSGFLNGTPKSAAAGSFGAPNFGSSTGEGILPGTKMEYTNEYVLSVQREVKPGMVASIRYMDRQFGRIVEDNGSTSPEGAYVDSNYAGGIANITGASDFFVNETEVVYTPAAFAAANGGRAPGQTCPGSDPLCTAANAVIKGSKYFGQYPYVAPAAGCTYSNDTSVAFGSFFPNAATGTSFNGACVTNAATTGASYGADGKPDGFADPRRHYQSLELELNRSLRNHWQARINYRYAKLFGNYEGFFRNDNGQSDPGISSLFDFTQGAIGLLGDQFKRGYLNTDHRHVANALIAYSVDKSTPFIGHYGNGLTFGSWLHATSGAPLSAYSSHPAYLNAGEVPLGGRGTKGYLPVAMQLDLSATDAVKVSEKFTVRGSFDGFNVFDSQPITGKVQNIDTSFGSGQNADGPVLVNGLQTVPGKPSSFQQAFRMRFKLAIEF